MYSQRHSTTDEARWFYHGNWASRVKSAKATAGVVPYTAQVVAQAASFMAFINDGLI